ncbi:hypothetical protein, partial [Klebsiella pneumoniae]|uniref:hypothetical protein n=1 Tax=Klebsiella pneumoniae TaxID=573 RepID=UPI001D0E2C13
ELARKQRRTVLSDSSYAQRKKKYPPWEKLQAKWHTEFGHLNRGDMLTSEQHRCPNEKKKF